ncbi:hypothetical protein G3580_01970 [Nitrogeniibacter mangrovi]|uniref:Uncharacterized protein n=1 Tax=Nitrogeniibacter mangrovi TaxID=2016596 RepID=A0A6C1AYT2_9RHOO|nr:hypothetical protein [Nitrogeniibacter mangrovi]QID16497.1 hypothetical protein G3580_01970 [Nitrogeniibacter mangrovi]
MDSHDKPGITGAADYDDDVLDSGWMPMPEAVAPEPAAHPPGPNRAACDDADAFLRGIYRSEGSLLD